MNSAEAKTLAALWVKAQPTIASFIRVMVPDPQQAEDVLQETAVDCVGKFHTYDRSRPFEAWAVGVARYQVLEWRRKFARQRHIFDDELVKRIAAGYQRQSSRAESMRIALQECVGETSERRRKILELFYGREKKTDVIGDELHMTGMAVRQLLSRTRSALRRCIELRMAARGD
jgi:RNA polymerase sigma-70 factor (ECF subfamily)